MFFTGTLDGVFQDVWQRSMRKGDCKKPQLAFDLEPAGSLQKSTIHVADAVGDEDDDGGGDDDDRRRKPRRRRRRRRRRYSVVPWYP